MNPDPTAPPPAKPNVIKAVHEFAATLQAIAGDDLWPGAAAQCTVMLTHGWDDGTVDTMMIGLNGSAHARREDPTGREVRRFTGPAAEVDKAMRALPAPGEPGAPDGSDHTPGPDGMWT